MKRKSVRKYDFVVIVNIKLKLVLEYRKQEDKTGDRFCISKYDLPFQKGYLAGLNQKIYEIIAIATRNPRTCTIKDDQVEIMRVKVDQKELIEVI